MILKLKELYPHELSEKKDLDSEVGKFVVVSC